ncbi:type 1 periplasmic binding fold superfamily protein [Paucihalobacter ruber]|uniref:Type 1 periplasmic binding fold superfamily protein n=1 Tax=Paucihalobacter ruber TaxID=2567861 RepID=A0A506PHP3_9FLAO|nr:type 1 periplasmic binding fold superfamily protein [Paucihalobacter ruber]TPV33331.1 type 1 periplasmic binding fold superfamily protein [Paucihalobacter ruber]
MKAIKFLSMLAIAALTFNSCSNDDDAPDPVNEEEVITTVIVSLTPQGSGTAVTLTSRDLDGDGPNAPIVTVSGPLSVGTVYNGSIQFLNELENPAEDITEEVAEEDDEHQVFYSVTGGIGSITYTDSDGNGNPLGLAFTLSTSASATTGVMTVILRHEPNKNAAGVSDGDITNAGGETDIEVSFNVAVN